MEDKDIDRVVEILERESQWWNSPTGTKSTDTSHDPFKVLISCILSFRTKDELTHQAARRLFNIAESVQKMLKLSSSQIQRLIYPVGFYRNKAQVIKKVCQVLVNKYQGRVPSSLDELLSLPGVGRKTANLVLTLGFGRPGICVDTHVHRITNRWGYLCTKSPKQTESILRKKLPLKFWIRFNPLLVRFGQNICRPISPLCSRCPIKDFCQKVKVTRKR